MKLIKDMSIRLNYIFLAGIIFSVIIFSGCSKDYNNPTSPVTNPGTNEIIMQNIAFSPASKTIAVGTTIKWTNKDNTTHDVISGTPGNPSGLFNSGDFSMNGEFTFTFSQAGTFPYYCSHHAGMTGTIIVQ
jgi:plastocyanin